MKAEAILINRPHRQRRANRALYGLLTLFAWIVWVSLWLPLITALAWLFGLHTSYVELFLRNHTGGWHELFYLFWLALGCAVVITTWSAYNWRRFHKLDRRRGRPPASMTAMAERLSVTHASAIEMRSSDRIVLQFADDGSISHAPIRTPSDPRLENPR
jgi:biofilm PGA synthesis protein PgaD